MNFSEYLQQMVYNTPAVDFNKRKEEKDEQQSKSQKNQQDMLNQIGLAIKRR